MIMEFDNVRNSLDSEVDIHHVGEFIEQSLTFVGQARKAKAKFINFIKC